MNAKDLMIGDWVLFCGSEYYITKADFTANYEFEPIPLTPKILEKNGFEHKASVGYVYYDYETSNKIIVDMWDGTIKILHNYDIAFSRTYRRTVNVHELQHVLRVFEIEKEIVL